VPQGELELFQYHAFGLKIGSELQLPELHSGSGPPDVEIRHLRIPRRPKPPDSLRIDGNRVEFMLWNIRFVVTAGCRIEIEAPEDVEDIDVRIYLLGSVMGALLHQRGYLPIHANVVRLGSSAAAFAGHSGAGKSSLAAWLDERGHEVLSDDLCAVRFHDGAPMVFEGIPRMKLWPDTLRAFNRDEAGLVRVASDLEKFHVPLRLAARAGALDPVPLERVYILEKATPDAPAAIERLSGAHAAQALLANAFTWDLGQKILEDPRTQFDQCLAVAGKAQVFRVRRNWGMDRFAKEAEAIERHLEAPAS
jgi:hypothetical protein